MAMHCMGRAPFPSNFILHVTTRWASKSLAALTAKKRPGLIKTVILAMVSNCEEVLYPPCVSPQSPSQAFSRGSDRLISTACCILFTLTELCEAKSIKFARIFVDTFIYMGGSQWDGDKSVRRDSDTIGECERTQLESGHDNWGKGGYIYEWFVIGTIGKEDELSPRVSIR